MLSRLLCLLLVCGAAQCAQAQRTEAPESAVQAALLFNFSVFTDWPAVPADKLVFCTMGSQPVLDALTVMQAKKGAARALEVKAIASVEQAKLCHVLFVGNGDHKRIHELNQATRTRPLLLVAEENDFDPGDVVIVMQLTGDRYAFKINNTAAKERSLNLSSKLLRLASLVY